MEKNESSNNNSTSKKKESDHEILAKQAEFIQLVVDCLSLNHEKYDIVDDTFMCSLGDPGNITQKGMKSLASHCGKNTPCIEIIKQVKSYMTYSNPDETNDGNNNDNDSDGDSDSSSVARDSDDGDNNDVTVTSTSKSKTDNDGPSTDDAHREFIQLLTTYVNVGANNTILNPPLWVPIILIKVRLTVCDLRHGLICTYIVSLFQCTGLTKKGRSKIYSYIFVCTLFHSFCCVFSFRVDNSVLL